MTTLAFLLGDEPRNLIIEGHHCIYAGLALLIFGVAKAIFGRRRPALNRSYHLWLLFGSAVCLLVIGTVVGEDVSPMDIVS